MTTTTTKIQSKARGHHVHFPFIRWRLPHTTYAREAAADDGFLSLNCYSIVRTVQIQWNIIDLMASCLGVSAVLYRHSPPSHYCC